MAHFCYTALLARMAWMRLRFLLLMLWLAISIGQATATEAADDAEQQAALVALMGSHSLAADSVKGIALAPWGHAPANVGAPWVVAALVQPPGSEGDVQVWTGVLRRDGKDFHLLANDHSEHIDSMPLL